jgi:hypothetical protein
MAWELVDTMTVVAPDGTTRNAYRYEDRERVEMVTKPDRFGVRGVRVELSSGEVLRRTRVPGVFNDPKTGLDWTVQP